MSNTGDVLNVKESSDYDFRMAQGLIEHQQARAKLSPQDRLLLDALHDMSRGITEHIMLVVQATHNWASMEGDSPERKAVVAAIRDSLSQGAEAADGIDNLRAAFTHFRA